MLSIHWYPGFDSSVFRCLNSPFKDSFKISTNSLHPRRTYQMIGMATTVSTHSRWNRDYLKPET